MKYDAVIMKSTTYPCLHNRILSPIDWNDISPPWQLRLVYHIEFHSQITWSDIPSVLKARKKTVSLSVRWDPMQFQISHPTVSPRKVPILPGNSVQTYSYYLEFYENKTYRILNRSSCIISYQYHHRHPLYQNWTYRPIITLGTIRVIWCQETW